MTKVPYKQITCANLYSFLRGEEKKGRDQSRTFVTAPASQHAVVE